jgi:hypothetical protein
VEELPEADAEAVIGSILRERKYVLLLLLQVVIKMVVGHCVHLSGDIHTAVDAGIAAVCIGMGWLLDRSSVHQRASRMASLQSRRLELISTHRNLYASECIQDTQKES